MSPFSPLIVSLLAASLPLTGQSSGTLPGERIEIRPTLGELTLDSPSDFHDAGTVLAGAPAEHTFRFRVEGGPVRILKLRPSASCTIPPLSVHAGDRTQSSDYVLGEPLAEGTLVELTARLGTASARGPKTVSAGIDWAPLGLSSLDTPAVRRAKVRVGARVKPLFLVDPPFHSLGDIPLGESRTAASLIRTSVGRPFLLQLVEEARTEDDRVSTWVRPLHASPDGRSTHWQVVFEVDGRTRLGPGGAIVRARLVDFGEGDSDERESAEGHLSVGPRGSRVGVTLGFRVVGPFSFTDDFASFGLFAAETTVDRVVELSVPDPDFDVGRLRFRIEPESELHSDERMLEALQRVTCVALPHERGGEADDPASPESRSSIRLRLRIEKLPPSLEGVLRGRLVVETGDPSFPELTMRFSGVCRAWADGRER